MAKVTAVITSYKRDINIVERAVDSVLSQTFSDIETIVVDDNEKGSDYSSELKELCDRKNIRYLTQGGNMGACSARNYGINNASGEFIAFLDDDDEWLPEKIEKQLAVWDDDPDVGMVYCQGNIIDEESHRNLGTYNKDNIRRSLSFQDMLTKDYVGSTSQPIIKKECFDSVGGFWEKQPARQDYEMWIRISKKYSICGIDEILFNHNMHPGEQISRNYDKSYCGYINIMKRYKKAYDRFPKAKRNVVRILRNICVRKKSLKCLYYECMYIYLSFIALFSKNKQ